jgi:hypothetical protein
MFCPKCRYEYRAGFYVCPDCNTNLVDTLPEEQPEHTEYAEYAEILFTYNPADVAMIKSLLDAEDITYYFNAEQFMYVRPLAEPARLMVKKDEAEKAKEILHDLELSILGVNLKETDDENQKE